WTQIEITGRVVRLGRGHAAFRGKQKEFGFRAGLHLVALRGRESDHTLERHPRTSDERRAVGCVDVADHPCDVLAGWPGPGEHAKCREVWTQVHVRLFDTHKSLDRGSVEHDVTVERLLELPIRDFDVLDRAKDVGELQAHE